MKCPKCDTELKDHPANRCLDAWVAEKVMGLDVFWPKYGNLRGPWIRRIEGNYIPTEKDKPVSAYSVCIDAAWKVAEKLGLALVPQSTDDGFDWLALDLELVRYGDDITLVEKGDTAYSAPTAQLAICRTALATVEEVNDG